MRVGGTAVCPRMRIQYRLPRRSVSEQATYLRRDVTIFRCGYIGGRGGAGGCDVPEYFTPAQIPHDALS
eukprot:2039863-Prymnesium_polylepis.2